MRHCNGLKHANGENIFGSSCSELPV